MEVAVSILWWHFDGEIMWKQDELLKKAGVLLCKEVIYRLLSWCISQIIIAQLVRTFALDVLELCFVPDHQKPCYLLCIIANLSLSHKRKKHYRLLKKRISFVVLRRGTVYNAHIKLAKIWSIQCYTDLVVKNIGAINLQMNMLFMIF